MATTKIKFSPSINIVRDNNYVLDYVLTRNAEQAFNTILNDTAVGIKSHVLIGAYGTGKSSFLLALKQTLEGTYIHFKGYQKLLNSIPNYEFVSIVGEFASFESYFAKLYQLGKGYSPSDIIKAVDKHYKTNKKKGKGLAILVDEFGKFLEYASKHNPETELYFIQQLAEWANDSNNDTLFITTLHQDFSAYALHLNKLQRQEWDKVKGRIKDVPFNEPVEQLLFLASERISQKFDGISGDKNFDKLFDCIKDAKAFPLKDYFEKGFAKKLYPFDILSASVLTLSLQKYGQNERSLFSFIESNDHLGINEFNIKEAGYYSIPRVYDYLLNGYYSYLTTKYNPHYTQWSAIRRALERIEGMYKDIATQKQAEDLIKIIGLLNIFATASAKLEPRFYHNYAKYALGHKNAEAILEQLEKRKIIRYVNHSFKYILFEGTDLDIEIAIDDAGRLVEKVTNVVNHLNQYFEFPFISAKAVYYEKGTPRFFQFKLTEDPINTAPEGEVDGFINLVFSEDHRAAKKIEECSAECKEAILYGYYKNTSEIKNLLFEIQKVKKVKDGNRDDKVATKELDSILEHYVKLLNHYVLDNLYADNGNIVWYFQGTKLRIGNRQKFNQQLSSISEKIYSSTPVYRNELVNKTKISGQVAVARKRLIDKLFTSLHEENLGFTNTEFPPEKSIYLSLLKKIGLHQINDSLGILDVPTDTSFHDLWNAGTKFLESTKGKERNLHEFINTLLSRPFKLKQGFIDYWVPIFLLAKSDEFALYENGIYIPEINSDVLDLLNKRPSMFSIKAFDVVGVNLELFNRYRVFLNQAENHKPTNKLFIQTIKPFLVFYRDLPEYAKKTNRLKKKTNALRKVIANAKDPEKAFFDDFPTALGYSLLDLQKKPKAAEQFVKQLQESIRELRTIYDTLIDRFENYFVHEVLGSKASFPDYKSEISKRYRGLKTHLLLPYQKAFYSRLQSELDDRKSWLSSVAQPCIGKSLSSISDEEEIVLFEKIKDIIYELDNLTEISKENVNEEVEEVLKLEITSFVQGLNKNMLRIPKGKSQEVEVQIQKIKTNLSKDKKMNIAALTKLLQELLQNE
jgi:hypothetical protein